MPESLSTTTALEPSDEHVAELVQQGNTDEFRVLVGRYEAKMFRYAKRFLFDGDEAKDLVQDVFIKAYMNIQGFDTDRRFSPWIYRIAHNEFVNAIKKRQKDKNLISLSYLDVLFPHPLAKEAADDEVNRKELKALLDTSFEKLNPRYREPLALYYYEDMDYKEIAEILQVPVSTVGVWLQRGRAELRKMVEKKQ